MPILYSGDSNYGILRTAERHARILFQAYISRYMSFCMAANTFIAKLPMLMVCPRRRRFAPMVSCLRKSFLPGCRGAHDDRDAGKAATAMAIHWHNAPHALLRLAYDALMIDIVSQRLQMRRHQRRLLRSSSSSLT